MDTSPEAIPIEKSETQKQLDAFRAQILDIVNQEKRGEKSSMHLISDKFNPDELTEEDMGIWAKFQSGEITRDDLVAYQESVANSLETQNKGGEIPIDSRSLFCGFISNVAGKIFMRRELEEERKQKNL